MSQHSVIVLGIVLKLHKYKTRSWMPSTNCKQTEKHNYKMLSLFYSNAALKLKN